MSTKSKTTKKTSGKKSTSKKATVGSISTDEKLHTDVVESGENLATENVPSKPDKKATQKPKKVAKKSTKKSAKKPSKKVSVSSKKSKAVDTAVVEVEDEQMPTEESFEQDVIPTEQLRDDGGQQLQIAGVEMLEEVPVEQSEHTAELRPGTKHHVFENKIRAPRIIPNKEEEKKKKKRIGKKEEEETPIERYNPSVKTGLTYDQVNERVKIGKNNVVKSSNTKTYKSIIFGNIFTFFNLLTFVVAGALLAVGAWGDCFFLVIALCNMLIGIIQEIKAKKTIEKISLVQSPTAQVVREGMETKIAVSDIVLDDIIVLSTGKQICADCIVLEGSVEVNESLLTGESVPIKKVKGDTLFSGSFIVGGKCYCKVERVGSDTYTAKLASQAKKYHKPKSELMGTLNTIIKIIGLIIIPLGILMYMNNYNSSLELLESGTLQTSVMKNTITKTASSIIGMIPSGMFLLTSMALAVGVVKLAKKRTLVQDLYSIEMLARTDVLCLDKTGTITDGTMKVMEVVQIKKDLKYSLENLVGSMLTALDDNNQTSRALITHFGYSKDLTAETILPFNSTRKMSGVTFKNNETFVFGAPEYVLRTKNQQVENLIKDYASKGFRVLLFAQCDGVIKDDKIPLKREPIAVVVIEDHIREDATETIQWFKDNGVEIKIISGDNPITVSEVSRRVGVENADKYISLEGLSQQQVIDAADNYTVFGRVSPEQKCILVKALKNRGHKVAMTGDGVNDILALKEADCSIAMASGSEATRLVSNLVLMDSNFASMPSVVAEGRRVINNIQKSSSLFLMKTIYTILLSVLFLILSKEYPLIPRQVMILEFFVIGIPSFFLALQPNNDRIKGRFLPNLLSKSIPGALILFLSVVACFLFDVSVDTAGQFQTMASLALTFTGLMVLFRICKPIDVFRGIMFASMIVLTTLTLALSDWEGFFHYTPLSIQNSLFIVCIVLASYYVYDWIVKGLDKLIYLSQKKE